jgi:sarcosine oxidase subunit gamma
LASGPRAAIETSGVRFEEHDLGKALLRCHRRHAARAADVVAATCGLALPLTPNTVNVQPGARALWLEPGAWLITAGQGEVEGMVAALDGRADGEPHILATNLSSGRCVIGLSGPNARALIETGCPLDLHPRVFGAGRCAASLFNETSVIIDQLSDEPAYALIAERALAANLWDQLLDAVRWL